jgi:nucleotide-binding universal stress UspA family protein
MSEPDDRSTASLRPPPLEHIVVATDFSRGAAQAVDRTALLPLARGGSVSIVHVLPPKARSAAGELRVHRPGRHFEQGQRIVGPAVTADTRRRPCCGLRPNGEVPCWGDAS